MLDTAELENAKSMSIIVTKGTLDWAYPPFILGTTAAAMDVKVTMFFTFWGLDIVNKTKMNHLWATPVGNPSMGIPNAIGNLPGMTMMATAMMKREIEKLDFPDVEEFNKNVIKNVTEDSDSSDDRDDEIDDGSDSD